MLKNKKYMIGLMIMSLSISFISSKTALAVSEFSSTENDIVSYYNGTGKIGEDKNNIKWAYKVCLDGTISIWHCDVLKGRVEIPDKINGLTVSSIANDGLSVCEDITSVRIPSTVKSIGRLAFFGCTNLKNIEIPSSVKEISASAFENSLWLTNQRKSNPLVVVNNILIDGRDATGDIVIPSNVTSIADEAFTYINLDDSRRYSYGNTQSLTSIVISEGVTKIGEHAFAGCKNVTNLKIPFTVTEIGDGAFYDYSGDSIDIPNKTAKIGQNICESNVRINIGSSDSANQDFKGQGWYKNGDKWYWLWSDGTRLTGWNDENGQWYYFYGNGQMATEFIDLGGYSYYFKPNSSDGKAPMVTGWQYIRGKWFYFNPDSDGYKGLMKRACWSYINGNWYYFYYDGSMASNTWIDGYYVNSDGAWS